MSIIPDDFRTLDLGSIEVLLRYDKYRHPDRNPITNLFYPIEEAVDALLRMDSKIYYRKAYPTHFRFGSVAIDHTNVFPSVYDTIEMIPSLLGDRPTPDFGMYFECDSTQQHREVENLCNDGSFFIFKGTWRSLLLRKMQDGWQMYLSLPDKARSLLFSSNFPENKIKDAALIVTNKPCQSENICWTVSYGTTRWEVSFYHALDNEPQVQLEKLDTRHSLDLRFIG
jgi:hypothetical protein